MFRVTQLELNVRLSLEESKGSTKQSVLIITGEAPKLPAKVKRQLKFKSIPTLYGCLLLISPTQTLDLI